MTKKIKLSTLSSHAHHDKALNVNILAYFCSVKINYPPSEEGKIIKVGVKLCPIVSTAPSTSEH